MADILTPEARSKNMSAIHSKNTKPEIYFRKLLFSYGYRYRMNVRQIPGCPDLYLKKYNTAIFVHGCYWHRHEGCKYAYTPKSHVDFWQNKFDSNVRRDLCVKRTLHERNIKCLVIWECTVNRMKKSETQKDDIINKVIHFFISDEMYLEL